MIEIVQYKWMGKWGPFKVKSKCKECDSMTKTVREVIKGYKDVNFKVKPWLDEWYKVMLKGGWHPPVLFVGGKIVEQGKSLDKERFRRYLKE